MKLIIGYMNGAFWKGMSILSKFGFLLFIVPSLPNGVFAAYMFVFTICLMVARILSVGMEDQLAVEVAGNQHKVEFFAPLYWWSLIIGFFFVALYFITAKSTMLYLVIVGFQLAMQLLCGLVRSISPSGYEKLINFPSIIYFLLLLLFPSYSINLLLQVWTVAILLSQVVVLLVFKLPLTVISQRELLTSTRDVARYGVMKMVSSLLMLGSFRGLIVLPKYLVGIVASDVLAFAISVGEGCWQLAMVIVNRNYSYYCRDGVDIRRSLLSAVVIMCSMATVGIFVMLFMEFEFTDKIYWPLVGWALIFFGAMAGFMELRYFYWSCHVNSQLILVMQGVFILIEVLIIFWIPVLNWLPATALTCFVLVIGMLIWTWLTREKYEDC